MLTEMSVFSQEALRKLNKDELIAIIQGQDVKHERHEQHMENLVVEVRKRSSSLAKAESKLAISKNITTVMSEGRVQMEKKC